jgi:hypothetical protein
MKKPHQPFKTALLGATGDIVSRILTELFHRGNEDMENTKEPKTAGAPVVAPPAQATADTLTVKSSATSPEEKLPGGYFVPPIIVPGDRASMQVEADTPQPRSCHVELLPALETHH